MENNEWCMKILLFEYQFERDMSPETFLVRPDSEPYRQLLEKLRSALVVVGVTRGGSKFLWELKLPTPSGSRGSERWSETRLTVAKAAQTTWLKPVADMTDGGYHYDQPLDPSAFPDPDWSNVEFGDLIRIAYKDRIIDSMDHPAVVEHRGG